MAVDLALQPLFFVHIQKTAGGTFRRQIQANVEAPALYPYGPRIPNEVPAYWSIEKLRNITPEQRRTIRAYAGHFPYIASALVEPAPLTACILRDPIERTVSYLKMCSHHGDFRGMSLEQIYDDPLAYPFWIHNHQAKVFAMTLDDKLETVMDVIDIDDKRLRIAKSQLEQVDLLGLTGHFGEFVEMACTRLGWPVTDVDDVHVSHGDWDVPDKLLRRITADNEAELDFFDYASRLLGH